MTNRQESKWSMYQVVKELLRVKDSVISALPNYATFLSAFAAAIVKIAANAEQQMYDKKGARKTKEEMADIMKILASKTVKKVIAYAKFAKDETLLAEMKQNESKLARSADNLMATAAQGIYSRAQANLTELMPYGVTAASQAAFEAAITGYNEWTGKPRTGIVERKAVTEALLLNFKEADEALANIDALVEIVRYDEPRFYTEYTSARKLVAAGTGTLGMRIKVIAAAGRLPMGGVMLRVERTPGEIYPVGTPEFEPVIKKTTAAGSLQLKNVPVGGFLVTASCPGFAVKQVPVIKYDGQICDVEIEMEASSAIH